MPRTKKQTQKSALRRSTRPAANGPVTEVMTLSEAAAYLRLPEDVILLLIQEQRLPARHVNDEWRFLKSAIQDWLRTGTPPAKTSKEVWMELAGKWKDDPTLDDMLAEIYRQRGRPMLEEQS